MQFDDASLDEVLGFISRRAAIPISCHWEKLKSVGVDRKALITLNLRDVSVAEALSVILTDLNARGDVQFQIGTSDVLISTRAEFDRSEAELGPRRVGLLTSLILAALAVVSTAAWAWKRKSRSLQRRPDNLSWTAIGIIALAAGVAAVATWKHGPPFWESVFKSGRWTLTADRGALRLWHTPADPAASYQDVARVGRATALDQQKLFDHAGFLIRWGGPPFNSWVAGMPLWAFVPLSAALPAIWFARFFRRRRRYSRGLCLTCGYNLAGNTSGICPECGGLSQRHPAML